MGIIRLLIILFLAYLAYRLVKIIFVKRRLSGQDPRNAIDEMVQDPNCGVFVARRQAERRFVGGEERFFCSKKCADEFEKR